MHEVIRCPQCQKQLRMPEDCAGRRVKCPACPSTFVAPAAGHAAPVAAEEDIVLAEASDVGAPRKRRERDEDRRPLRKGRAVRRRRAYEDDDDDEDEDDYRYRRRLWPHRGGMVLGLGILSLVLCWTVIGGLKFGAIALVLAYMDLSAMDRGEMDDAGRGTTRAGQVCALIGMCLSALMLFAFCLLSVALPHHH
jgi:hypothetical protein